MRPKKKQHEKGTDRLTLAQRADALKITELMRQRAKVSKRPKVMVSNGFKHLPLV